MSRGIIRGGAKGCKNDMHPTPSGSSSPHAMYSLARKTASVKMGTCHMPRSKLFHYASSQLVTECLPAACWTCTAR